MRAVKLLPSEIVISLVGSIRNAFETLTRGILPRCADLTEVEYSSPEIFAGPRFENQRVLRQRLQRLQCDLNVFKGYYAFYCGGRRGGAGLVRWCVDAIVSGLLLRGRTGQSFSALSFAHDCPSSIVV